MRQNVILVLVLAIALVMGLPLCMQSSHNAETAFAQQAAPAPQQELVKIFRRPFNTTEAQEETVNKWLQEERVSITKVATADLNLYIFYVKIKR